MSDTNILANLNPKALWQYFYDISQIPHQSGNEAMLAQYILEWSKAKDYEACQDATGNILIKVPPNCSESKESIVLQSHLDMVGEKDSSSNHDFDKDALKLQIDGDFVTADQTTLGADNGIGVAASLAIASDRTLSYPPLELLFTVDEERGLTGAQGLKSGFLTGSKLINLDTEEEGAIYIGCAGGVDSIMELPIQRNAQTPTKIPFELRVFGLKGGHSGMDINKGYANAIEIGSWLLDRLKGTIDFDLVDFSGGNKRNAICREVVITLLLSKQQEESVRSNIGQFVTDITKIYGKSDPNLAIELKPLPQISKPPLTTESSEKLLHLIMAQPHGILAMSNEVDGLVETSTNLGIVEPWEQSYRIVQLTRSSVTAALNTVQGRFRALAALVGANFKSQGEYPGWRANIDSPLLKQAASLWEQLFHQAPQIMAIHAGLECGIIGKKLPGIDMISIGPQIEMPHSPLERVRISSVANFYRYLTALLASL